ncbi:MAG: GNAT family N-acetyltransferase [Oscillospiraceae bacterium]|nr:GNAT family N-acetyltransferase [Oscillospiraceae bacterium]MDY2847588.1 GNAT family N-acetyltransferase [Oscillospiraceae bacterium]
MVELTLVTENEKEILSALLEKYQYEFSQWDKKDVDEKGLYGYEYFDCYFEEENRFPYFIKVDSRLAGFVMVSDYPEVPGTELDFCLSEFFVMHKYRRSGVGREAVRQLLERHYGRWQLKRHPHNTASVYFWNKVIDELTDGNYRLVEAYPDKEADYEDGTPADVFFFEN